MKTRANRLNLSEESKESIKALKDQLGKTNKTVMMEFNSKGLDGEKKRRGRPRNRAQAKVHVSNDGQALGTKVDVSSGSMAAVDLPPSPALAGTAAGTDGDDDQ